MFEYLEDTLLICILLLSWSSQKQLLVCLYWWSYDVVARLTGTLFLLWQVEMAFMKKIYWDEQLYTNYILTMIPNCPTIHHKSHPSKWDPGLIRETIDRGQNTASALKGIWAGLQIHQRWHHQKQDIDVKNESDLALTLETAESDS